MNAIIPHKDTLFFLAGIQRNIISILNREANVFPLYPLFAMTDQDIPGGMTGCTIGLPETEWNKAYFPVEIEYADHCLKLSIFFARTVDGKEMPEFDLPQEIKNAFPKKERIFRTANAIFENNTWQIYDDRWIKII